MDPWNNATCLYNIITAELVTAVSYLLLTVRSNGYILIPDSWEIHFHILCTSRITLCKYCFILYFDIQSTNVCMFCILCTKLQVLVQ